MSAVLQKMFANNSVHPTALVHPSAVLGSNNVIGPFVTIGAGVHLGNGNYVGASTHVGVPPEVRAFNHIDAQTNQNEASVVIGNDNVIRESVQIQSGWREETVIGNAAFIMHGAYVAHDARLSDSVTLASSVSIAGGVRIGRSANLGMGALVHQGVKIGACAMVGMGAVVTRDVSPAAKVFGSPAVLRGINRVGLDRMGVDADDIELLGVYLSLDATIEVKQQAIHQLSSKTVTLLGLRDQNA